MDYSLLEKIGLTNSEIKVYLALIDTGASTVGPITSKSKVASSKTYELLDKLIEKGLVTTYKEDNIKYFKAVFLVNSSVRPAANVFRFWKSNA